MARTKGSYSLAGTLEVLADAPADARLKVNTVADLTANGSFPYKYVGMIVSVESTQEAYMLIGSDPTVAANWEKQGSGSGSDGVELTQAQYNALPQSEKMNGTTYYITDSQGSGGVSVGVSDLSDVELDSLSDGDTLVYDATEQKWVNSIGGSTITDYIPVVTTLPTPDASMMGKMVFYNGTQTTTSSGLVLRKGTIYHCTNDPEDNIVWFPDSYSMEGYIKSDDAIELTTTIPAVEAGDMRCRLNLKRSTSPTSGSALPITSGAVYTALANKRDKLVYSTSEKAIGEWINGKTLYEKVIDCGNMPNSTTKSVSHGISGLSKVISCEGCYNANSGISAGSLNYSDTGNMSYNTAVSVDATYVKIKTATNYSSYNCFVILRYTK